MDLLTFGLAFAAYVMLCGDVLAHAHGRPRRAFTIALAAVLAAHVGLVWGHRYGWSLDAAVASRWAGFAVFHAAFAMILAAAF